MSPRHLHFGLSLLRFAALATLLRSIAFDRWITVAASVMLLVAAFAMQRGRTWGVALSLAVGVALAGVCALGIAPPWFAVVGLLAALPFARMWPAFARFDRGATALLAGVAAAFGAVGAVAWKELAWPLFRAFPALVPSLHPHHGLALLAVGGAVAVSSALVRRVPQEPEARVRVATGAVASEDREALAEIEGELVADDALDRGRLRTR